MSILPDGIEGIIVKFANKLLTVLKIGAASIATRVMAGLGLSWVNFAYVLPDIKGWLVEKTSGLPQFALEFMGACGIDIFMTLVISAMVAKAGFRLFLAATSSVEQYVVGAGA